MTGGCRFAYHFGLPYEYCCYWSGCVGCKVVRRSESAAEYSHAASQISTLNDSSRRHSLITAKYVPWLPVVMMFSEPDGGDKRTTGSTANKYTISDIAEWQTQ